VSQSQKITPATGFVLPAARADENMFATPLLLAESDREMF
jgi:hypothetical protein